MSSRATPNALTIKTCWIPRNVQEQFEDLARQWAPLEVGGVLAGYWHGDVAVITHCIGPGEHASHHASTFAPDYAFHEREIARLYATSQGTAVYLGDWHTHPSGAASLSPLDRRTLRAIADAPEARCTQPLMVLLAGSGDEWSTQVFSLGLQRRFLPRKIVQAELRVF
jgi:integrative and conjugative element protein (TIGR02256 family)